MNKKRVCDRYIILETLFYLHSGIIGATYILYFYDLGYSKFVTNIITSVFSIFVFIFEIPSGSLSDNRGNKSALMISGIALSSSMALFLYAGNISILILGQIFWGISYAMQSGALEAWVVNTAELHDSELDAVFSKSAKIRNIVMVLGGVLGTLIAKAGLRYIWIIPLITAVIYTLLVLRWVTNKELNQSELHTYNLKINVRSELKESFITIYNTIRKGEAIKTILLFNMGIAFVISPLFTYWSPYILQLGGGELGVLAWMWIFIKMSMAAGNALWEYLHKKYNRIQALFVICISFGAIFIIAAMNSNLLVGFAVIIGMEFLLGVIDPIQKTLINKYVNSDNRATMLSVNSMAERVGGWISLVLMGVLGDVFSIAFTWIIAGVTMMFLCIFVAKIKRNTN